MKTAHVDHALKIGSVNETVTVTGEATLLETSSLRRARSSITPRSVNLPLNMRDPFTLAALTPGVQPGRFLHPRVFQAGFQSDFSVNGGASYQNDILLDGTSNTWPVTAACHDSLCRRHRRVQGRDQQLLREVRPQRRRNIDIVTKSGTNSLKGTVYEFLRNKALDANDFFNNRAGIPAPPSSSTSSDSPWADLWCA